MRSLIIFALLSVAAAKPKPGGLISPWGGHGISSYSVVQQPTVAVAQPVVQQVVAQPVVHAAPVAYAKPAATSYSSFQRIIHPVAVAQPVVHAPVVHSAPVYSQPIVHAAPVVSQPIVQVEHAPIVQQISQPYVSSVGHGFSSIGHGW